MSSKISSSKPKQPITPRIFSDMLKSNKEVTSLKTELSNNRIRCKLLWYTLIKLNQQIDNFEELYNNLDESSQIKLLDRLDKESKIIYKKYIECGEIDDELEFSLDELINTIGMKYRFVDPSTSILISYNKGSGIKTRKYNKKRKNKKNTRIRKRKIKRKR